MRITKAARIAATIAFAALVALGASACGEIVRAEDGGSTVRSEAIQPEAVQPEADPRAAVAAAAKKIGKEPYSFHMTMSPEVAMTAKTDPVAKKAQATMKVHAIGFNIESEMILVGDDMYYKMANGILASGKWMRFSAADADLNQAWNAQQMDPAEWLKRVSDVHKVDAHTYKGTLKADDMSLALGTAVPNGVKKLGPVPFTLVVDGKGRVSRLELLFRKLMPDKSDRTMVMTVTDYGKPVSVKAPPKNQVQNGFGF